MTTVGRCPTPRTRRREARGAVLAGFALVLPPLVRLWPLLSPQGLAYDFSRFVSWRDRQLIRGGGW